VHISHLNAFAKAVQQYAIEEPDLGNLINELFFQTRPLFIQAATYGSFTNSGLYSFHYRISDITTCVKASDNDEMAKAWLKVMIASKSLLVRRVGMPPCPLDLSLQCRRFYDDFGYKIEKVTLGDTSVVEELDDIWKQALGHSMGREVIELLLKSNDVRCLTSTTKDGEKIGFLLGAYHTIAKGDTSICFFHIWCLARKPQAAGIDVGASLVQYLKRLLKEELKDRNLHFVTANIESGNKAVKKLCASYQFVQLETLPSTLWQSERGLYFAVIDVEMERPNGQEISRSIHEFARSLSPSSTHYYWHFGKWLFQPLLNSWNYSAPQTQVATQ
jgi:hypothetical protein